MEDVLAHLPVKSLVRCKTLSRKWQSFISGNSHFRGKYLSTTNTKTGKERSLLLGFFITKSRVFDVAEPVRFLPTTTEGKSISLKKRKREADGHKLVCETRAQSDPLHIYHEFLSFLVKRKRPIHLVGSSNGKEEDGHEVSEISAHSVPLHIDDESLSFLGQQSIHLAGSSSGFLLCSVEQFYPKTYFLCSPITKQWVALPTPSATSERVGHGFVCHTSSPCLDKVDHYTVVRVIWNRARVFGFNIRFEILSSESPKHWELISSTCPFSFYPDLSSVSSAIIDKRGAIYVNAILGNEQMKHHEIGLLIFDRWKKEECLQLMEFPPTEKGGYQTIHFGQSDGLLLYAQHEGELGQLKIWELADDKDDGRRKWCLRQKIRLEITMENFPELVHDPLMGQLFDFIAFHPTNPRVLFLIIDNTVVICDVNNSALELLCDFDAQGWRRCYFIFPYTYGLCGDHLFLDS